MICNPPDGGGRCGDCDRQGKRLEQPCCSSFVWRRRDCCRTSSNLGTRCFAEMSRQPENASVVSAGSLPRLKQLKQLGRSAKSNGNIRALPNSAVEQKGTTMFTYALASGRIVPGIAEQQAAAPPWSSRPSAVRDMSIETEILVVDDELDLRETVAEYLVRYGFAVRTAMDGEAMAARLKEQPIS
jgi:hypothetical protein